MRDRHDHDLRADPGRVRDGVVVLVGAGVSSEERLHEGEVHRLVAPGCGTAGQEVVRGQPRRVLERPRPVEAEAALRPGAERGKRHERRHNEGEARALKRNGFALRTEGRRGGARTVRAAAASRGARPRRARRLRCGRRSPRPEADAVGDDDDDRHPHTFTTRARATPAPSQRSRLPRAANHRPRTPRREHREERGEAGARRRHADRPLAVRPDDEQLAGPMRVRRERRGALPRARRRGAERLGDEAHDAVEHGLPAEDEQAERTGAAQERRTPKRGPQPSRRAAAARAGRGGFSRCP